MARLKDRLAIAEDTAARCETLLHEGDHRIKNSLQIVASLMRMQARHEDSADVTRALISAAARVHSIARIHDALRDTNGKDAVDLGKLLNAICASLQEMAADGNDILVIVKSELIRAPVALSRPIALAVNELVINALRHAFVGNRSGTIYVKASATSRELRIEVSDDGVGMVLDQQSGRGFGSKLVKMLTRKMDGTLSIFSGPGEGARFTITAPAPTVR